MITAEDCYNFSRHCGYLY